MSVVRRDKRSFRRIRPRRVGAGMVALLALGTGAGCGQAMLRPNPGPGLAAESLGLVDAAIPSRKVAWVGADGRRDMPLPLTLPSREPDNLNRGLSGSIAASGTTWNGWKVPAVKSPSLIAASSAPAALPDVKAAPPLQMSSGSSEIPLPTVRRAGDDRDVDMLLAASRQTKIAPPLTHIQARPAVDVAKAPEPPFIAPAVTEIPGMVVAAASPSLGVPPTNQETVTSDRPPSSVVANESGSSVAANPESPEEHRIVVADANLATNPTSIPGPVPAPVPDPTPIPLGTTTAVAASQVEESRPTTEPSALAPPEPNKPVTIVAPVDLRLADVVARTPEKADEPTGVAPELQNSARSQTAVEIDPLVAASETTGIPLPKRTEDAEVSTPTVSAVMERPMTRDPVAGVPPETDIPMPVPFQADKANAFDDSERQAKIPSPISATDQTREIVATVNGTAEIPMPVPIAPKTDDPLAAASRATNIPIPVPVEPPAVDPVAAASQATNIPMPVPVSNPSPVPNPLIEASRTTKIPLPIPPETTP